VVTRQLSTPPKAKANASIKLQVAWLNSLVHPFVPVELFEQLPTLMQSWVRNFVFSALVYFGLNFSWAYYIYECFGGDLFPKQNMPTWSDMREQMWVASWSLPWYSLLPALTEEIIERGWTLSYSSISDVGVPQFVGLFVLYIAFVEFGVYWMHRGLHDIPAGYKCVPQSYLQPICSFKSFSRGLHRFQKFHPCLHLNAMAAAVNRCHLPSTLPHCRQVTLQTCCSQSPAASCHTFSCMPFS
jgi:hypothetical protein